MPSVALIRKHCKAHHRKSELVINPIIVNILLMLGVFTVPVKWLETKRG
jgi:hypothetical protein